jgi:hypothetical protein
MGAFLRQEVPVLSALSQTLVPEVNIEDCVRHGSRLYMRLEELLSPQK